MKAMTAMKAKKQSGQSAGASGRGRIDLHVHTSIGSPCAFYDPLDIPRYAEADKQVGEDFD